MLAALAEKMVFGVAGLAADILTSEEDPVGAFQSVWVPVPLEELGMRKLKLLVFPNHRGCVEVPVADWQLNKLLWACFKELKS